MGESDDDVGEEDGDGEVVCYARGFKCVPWEGGVSTTIDIGQARRIRLGCEKGKGGYYRS